MSCCLLSVYVPSSASSVKFVDISRFRMSVTNKLDSPERTYHSPLRSETILHCLSNIEGPEISGK